MALSWNEIKERAVSFSKEWENTVNENADAKPFLVEFFNVFGITQRKVSTFEQRIKKLDESGGFIDLLWKGTLLIEMKSRGKNLDKAYQQAKDYLQTLEQKDLPKYIIVSDFENFRLYDLEDDSRIDFLLKDLVSNVQHFGFIAGYQKKVFKAQDPVNIKAAELMGKLHDKMEAVGYEGHVLELYLVRLLFCLFADDTTIFEKDAFKDFLDQKTSEDGSDLAARLNELFYVLNIPKEKRLKNLDEQLNAFPYVNGKLFEETLPPASFNSEMRKSLLECCSLNWGKISPAIFGSMFQSVMNPKERRNLGAHYTSEKNILKLIKPLFLDDLWTEFEEVKNNKNKLTKFHDKISLLRFLDPACGCGNFLVISYRELRLLEIEIIKILQKGQQVIDIENLIKINVDRFYGIEIEEFPAQIAQVALWLIDHQMNMAVSEAFGEYYIRLPLRKSPVIVQGNALRIDWQTLIDPIPWEKKEQKFDFIFGNPPFIGTIHQNIDQKKDIDKVFSGISNSGMLDYVCAWYKVASDYIQQTQIKCAFVSTNSISQGLQPAILWNVLFQDNLTIHFAHQTFKWTNESKGNAAVHVVIIGFGNFDIKNKRLFEYSEITAEPHEKIVSNINPYLISASNCLIDYRPSPICKTAPVMTKGSQPTDGGHLLLDEIEKEELIKNEPQAKKYIKRIYTNQTLLNNIPRYCLWLKEIRPDELKTLPFISERVRQVRKMRLESKKEPTRRWAEMPTLFTEDRQPTSDFLLIPVTTSERRKYIPILFVSKEIIANNSCLLIPRANFYHFGILHSLMHMVWVKVVSGRMKSDFQYSASIVYNNFPWPENPTQKQKQEVESAANFVLEARKEFPENSLADLYDPLSMPPQLVKAHQQLDKAVDLCYRSQPFTSEAKRMEFLFELYEKYTAGLFAEEKPKKKKVKV